MTGEDRKAADFVGLLEQSRSRLFGYIYALVLNLDDTEDLYQQVVSVLWQKFDDFKEGTEFTNWAILVAKLTVKNFIRRRRRSKVLFDEEIVERIIDEQLVLEVKPSTARSDALANCLKRLPGDDRRLVDLCYGGDRKIRDIADSEGRSADAIYVSLHRIRKALFNCIENTLKARVTA